VAPSIREKFVLTSPTNGGLSVGIVRSPIQATEFFFIFMWNRVMQNTTYEMIGVVVQLKIAISISEDMNLLYERQNLFLR
jgi:hypothetical protein